MKFGEKLTGLRKSRGMSQEELASQISVSRQAVSRWESGDTMPCLLYTSLRGMRMIFNRKCLLRRRKSAQV